jgi:hypothetical protein
MPNPPSGGTNQPMPPGGEPSQPVPPGGTGQSTTGNQPATPLTPSNPSPPPTLPPPPVTPAPVPQTGTPPATPGPGAGSLVGTWKASPAPGVSIETTFQADGHFTWKFSQGGQNESFSGTYVHNGDSLVFTRQDGEKMDGTATLKGNGLHFRLKNTDPADPGLDFAK